MWTPCCWTSTRRSTTACRLLATSTTPLPPPPPQPPPHSTPMVALPALKAAAANLRVIAGHETLRSKSPGCAADFRHGLTLKEVKLFGLSLFLKQLSGDTRLLSRCLTGSAGPCTACILRIFWPSRSTTCPQGCHEQSAASSSIQAPARAQAISSFMLSPGKSRVTLALCHNHFKVRGEAAGETVAPRAQAWQTSRRRRRRWCRATGPAAAGGPSTACGAPWATCGFR